MRRASISLVLIVCTAVFVWLTLMKGAGEEAVPARIVTVRRGDVHQVAALTGRLTYDQEEIVLANLSGVISHIYVSAGQRVERGEAMVRWEDGGLDAVMSAVAASSNILEQAAADHNGLYEKLGETLVLRADKASYIRDVYVKQNTPVMTGTPLLRLTSGQQMIQCQAALKDARPIEAGMWAWLFYDGVKQGIGQVVSVGSAEVEPITGLSYVSILIQPENYLELPEGAGVDADIYLGGSDDVMTLPVEAITERGSVWWVVDGKCTEISGNVVLCDEMNAWVELPEGMQVAIGEFREGQRVLEAKE